MAGAEVIEMRDGTVRFVERLFSAAENEHWFTALRDGTHWRQEEIRLFGRKRRQPRLTAWHGDPRRGLLAIPAFGSTRSLGLRICWRSRRGSKRLRQPALTACC